MLTKNDRTTETNSEGQQRATGSRRPALAWRLTRALAQIVLMVAVLAGGLFATQRLIATKPELPSRPPIPTVYTVETVTAERVDRRPNFVAYGEIVAGREVELRSLVAGEVVAINQRLRPGAQVRRGDDLVEIDRFNYEGALREASANLRETEARIAESRARIDLEQSRLARAQEQLELARKDRARIVELVGRGTATQKQLEDRDLVISQRQASVEQASINISAEQARLAQQQAVIERLQWKQSQAERNLRDTVLVAPFDGIIRAATVEAGKMVSANDVVVSMYEQGNLEVRFTLTDERFGSIQAEGDGLIGRKVEVFWVVGPSEHRFLAEIVRIGAEIAARRGGVDVYARLEASEVAVRPRPGAFVEIRVPDRLYRDHFALPESAVYDNDTVYAVIDGRLERRTVSVAAYDGDEALVTGALTPGESLLVTRIAEIGEGLRVRAPGEAAGEAGGQGTPQDSTPASPNGDDAMAFRQLDEAERAQIVAAVREREGLSESQWQALPMVRKRTLIRNWREQQRQ